jgi:hypothetical protein
MLKRQVDLEVVGGTTSLPELQELLGYSDDEMLDLV